MAKKEKEEKEGHYCSKCDDYTMVLAENGLVYVCEKCDNWHYRSS